MIDDGETGFIVPAEDARALADALLWILENPRACQDFGSRARERAVSRFSAEECARVHLAAYEYVLSRGKRSRRNRALA
jgi:glycosyltransferase involved in cell wall biosynthesis